jgi:flagellar biosynthesis protein FlhG
VSARRRTPRSGERRSAPRAESKSNLRVIGRGAETPDTLHHPSTWKRPGVPTVMIASGKDGVGKSNLAANLAVALAEQARVLLVDADLAQANLDLLLGLHPRFDLHHVLAGEKTPEEIVITGPKGLKLVPAASGAPDLTELDDYRREFLLRSLGHLTSDVDLMILDLPSGVSRHVTEMCVAGDQVVIVTTPEVDSDAYALIRQLHQRGWSHPIRLVVSHAGTPEEAHETAQHIRLMARRFLRLEVELLGSVPFDPSVIRAARRQEPVITAFPESPASLAYRAIAAQLWNAPSTAPPSERVPQRLEA